MCGGEERITRAQKLGGHLNGFILNGGLLVRERSDPLPVCGLCVFVRYTLETHKILMANWKGARLAVCENCHIQHSFGEWILGEEDGIRKPVFFLSFWYESMGEMSQLSATP